MKIVKQLPPIVAFDPESPEDMSIGPRDVNTNERLIVADEEAFVDWELVEVKG